MSAPVIVGALAGGPVALQIALRYPQRCAGLVMLSAISQPLHLTDEYLRFARLLLAADFVPWLAARINVKQAIRNNGPLPPLIDAVYRPQVNEYNGKKTLQFLLEHWSHTDDQVNNDEY